VAKQSKLIKICLTDDGEDSETPWAEDLGPAPGPKGSRKVKLVNVPFLHAKPTWGDTIVVSPVAGGLPTWDSGGVEWDEIGTRLLVDSGRHAIIIDYAPKKGDPGGHKAFSAIAAACRELDVACEGCFGPDGKTPGRVYLAANDALTPEAVMERLRTGKPPHVVTQIHADVAQAKKPAAKKATKKPAAKKPAAKKSSPRKRVR